jgi:hypothetical protein
MNKKVDPSFPSSSMSCTVVETDEEGALSLFSGLPLAMYNSLRLHKRKYNPTVN